MEVFTSAVGVIFYRGFLAGEYVQKKSFGLEVLKDMVALKKSKPGVIITIAREHAKI